MLLLPQSSIESAVPFKALFRGYAARMRGTLTLLAALVLAACGSDSESEKKAAAPASSTAEQSTTSTAEQPEASSRSRSADEEKVAKIAQQYMDGMVNEDFKASCEARTKEEQAFFAKEAGSCERAFEAIVRSKPGIKTLFKDAKIGDVRVKGDTAEADVLQPEQSEPAVSFLAKKENGRWGLVSGEADG